MFIELVENLDKVQDSSGSFSNVGAILTEWVSTILTIIFSLKIKIWYI